MMSELELLQMRLDAAEEQRKQAVILMQSVQPGIFSREEEKRLQRLRDYAYHLQNELDRKPAGYNMDYMRARLSAVCWAVSKISGTPFTTLSVISEPQQQAE